MGAHLSKWIKEKSASDQAADCRQCDEAVELRLAALLVELRDRDKRTRKTRTVASVEGAATEPLRATDVVPDQLVEELTLERKEAQEIYVPYLRRAAASKPLVERIDVKIGNQQYNMPRVTLPEAATLEELAAMNAQYISYGMLGKGSRRKLHKRQEAALAAVGGMNQDRFVVDGSGFGALVYVHDAFSDAGLRGKRVLLLLDAEMGIDKGYMKKCFGSATPDGDRVRHDLKSSQKVLCSCIQTLQPCSPPPCSGLATAHACPPLPLPPRLSSLTCHPRPSPPSALSFRTHSRAGSWQECT